MESNQERSSEKSGWENVGATETRYLKVSNLPNNEIEGVYSRKMETQYGPTYILLSNGEQIGINGCGALDFKMDSINIGDRIKIVYKGKESSTDKAGKPITFHSLDLFRKAV